jgi:rod shape-determining protein MreD
VKPSLFQRMDLWAKQCLPIGTALILLLFNLVPTRIPGFAGVTPALVVMATFYWSIYRPDLFSPLSAFLVGAIYDVLTGTPVGVTAFVLLVVHGATASQRRFFLGNTFFVAWWGFALVALGAMALQWVLVSAVFGRIVESRAVLFSYLMTLSFYPVVSWTLARTQVAFLRQ